jgi:hypothetical protein
MKKIITILLCLLSFNCIAQSVYKFRCFESNLSSKYEYSKKVKWESTDFLVVINLDADKIDTYANSEMHIDLVDKLETVTKNDYVEFNYQGVDEEGLRCVVSVIVYKDQDNNHKATLKISYSDYVFTFRLMKN